MGAAPTALQSVIYHPAWVGKVTGKIVDLLAHRFAHDIAIALSDRVDQAVADHGVEAPDAAVDRLQRIVDGLGDDDGVVGTRGR